MGIPTLIKTLTASDSATLSFVDGASDVVLDSTYDEYMFVFTDINPATDDSNFTFQVNATDDAGGGYDTSLITSTYFRTLHGEDGSGGNLSYQTGLDIVQSASFCPLTHGIGIAADESCAGIFHLFNPASTTYVKNFYARFATYGSPDAQIIQSFAAGYVNDTTAIDEIQFKMASGNFDGVIQLFGIA